jgi:UDPglucose 6-dehydrogenase
MLLILTDWPEIKKLDLKKLREVMDCPVVIDGRNVFSPETMKKMGFTYFSVGRP